MSRRLNGKHGAHDAGSAVGVLDVPRGAPGDLSNEELAAFFDMVPQPVVVMDRNHTILYLNVVAAQAAGSVIVTVVPTPRALVTSIVPPVSSTFRFAIVRPSPVPVAFVEKYGSKIRAMASASIPTPVSATSTVTMD